ncbi:hypothetical protein HK102_010052, partial [Quaeritorhiza haematococci]
MKIALQLSLLLLYGSVLGRFVVAAPAPRPDEEVKVVEEGKAIAGAGPDEEVKTVAEGKGTTEADHPAVAQSLANAYAYPPDSYAAAAAWYYTAASLASTSSAGGA